MTALLLLLLLLVPAAWAARLELALDTRELVVGQTVSMQVQLLDGEAGGLPRLETPEGVEVRYTGQSQSIVIVNFDRKRIVRYSYALTATQPGEWEVGPVRIDAGGQTLTAAPVTLTVTDREAEAETGSGVMASLSDDAPFLGEVVTFEAEYRRTERVLDARWTLPDFDGFRDEKSTEATRREYVTEIDGQQTVVEHIVVPLVAVGEGRRAFGRTAVTAQIPTRRPSRSRRDFFFERTEVRSETWTSDPLQATIRPLPEAGRPAGFSGLVGRFAATAQASSRQVALGESLTLEVRIAGNGTLAGFSLPALPPETGLRAYDDAPEIEAALSDDGFRSVATFRRAVVPEREGPLTIPPIRIPVFDPEAEAYVTVQTRPIEVMVTPGEAGGEVTSFSDGEADRRKDVEALGDDILPVAGTARVGDRTLASVTPLVVGLPLVPALALLGLAVGGRRRPEGPDPRTALRARLSSLPTEPDARLAALETLFREAAAIRLGREAPGLDRATVATLGQQADALYAALESARYGGGELGDIAARVKAFVEAT